jgi:iron-sulfur cluster assembly accessory protein
MSSAFSHAHTFSSRNKMIQMTERAIRKALDLQKENREWETKSPRLYLEGKGCDGFFYGVTFDDPTETDLRVLQEKEGVSIEILVDPDTHPFVENVLIDWVEDTRGTGFLVHNPDHRKFRGKFFKRPAWQQRLEEKRGTCSM